MNAHLNLKLNRVMQTQTDIFFNVLQTKTNCKVQFFEMGFWLIKKSTVIYLTSNFDQYFI